MSQLYNYRGMWLTLDQVQEMKAKEAAAAEASEKDVVGEVKVEEKKEEKVVVEEPKKTGKKSVSDEILG